MLKLGTRVKIYIKDSKDTADERFDGQVGTILFYEPTHGCPYKVVLDNESLNISFNDGNYVPFGEHELAPYTPIQVTMTRKRG